MALTISKNTDCTELIVTQTFIDITNPAAPLTDYTTIYITVYKNCCDCIGYSVPITIVDGNIDDNLPYDSTDTYTIVGNVITLYPKILGAGASGTGVTTFPDGVYKIIMTAIGDINGDGDEQVFTESNCFFMDCSTSCAVAKHISSLLKTPTDVEAHLLHFGLTNGSNCNCNCDEMCYLYKKLYDIIYDTDVCLCNCT